MFLITKSILRSTFFVLFLFMLKVSFLQGQGLHGYLGGNSELVPEEYAYGIGFHIPIWSYVPESLEHFQIGSPATWVIPDNTDNTTDPLCPIGTVARDNWPERGPTYSEVFQTMEGGVGTWVQTTYTNNSPKFLFGGTPSCYTHYINTPGFPYKPDDLLGMAQLSNRVITPPDGLPFADDPQGEFFGYAYLALPLTEAYEEPHPTGGNNWAYFVNSKNIKGPIAFVVPETWSELSKGFPENHGRGLDAKKMKRGGSATIEINTVPIAEASDGQGNIYTKIPEISFPVHDSNRSILGTEVSFYSKEAIFNEILNIRNGGGSGSGHFREAGISRPKISTFPAFYSQDISLGNRIPVEGIYELGSPTVFDDNSFGLQWIDNQSGKLAAFPQYFKYEDGIMNAISEEEVPSETNLVDYEFSKKSKASGLGPYFIDNKTAAWTSPGPAAGPFTVDLIDGSKVTYYWYKFIDQPVFQPLNYSEEQKVAYQKVVEHIHQNWTIDKEYMGTPEGAELASFDNNLIVTPPAGMEIGYVPIVVEQTDQNYVNCDRLKVSAAISDSENTGFQDIQVASEDLRNLGTVSWDDGAYGNKRTLRISDTYEVTYKVSENCQVILHSPPYALEASGIDGGSFIMNWKSVPGAKGYLIDVSTDPDFSTFISDWKNKEFGKVEKLEIDLVDGIETYYYRLRTLGFEGQVSDYSNVIEVSSITSDCQLDITFVNKTVSSQGSANGEVEVLLKGGVQPYQVRWSDGSSAMKRTSLSTGVYEVTISDANGCLVSGTSEVGLPIGTNSIGDRVWHDLNRNGRDDFGEPGISNVSVYMWKDVDNDNIPDFGTLTKTDQNGYYSFTNLNPVAHKIFVWEIDNWNEGDPLFQMRSTASHRDCNDNINLDDNGRRPILELDFINPPNVVSETFILSASDEPLNDGDREDPAFNYDPSGNMTIDFGFHADNEDCPKIDLYPQISTANCNGIGSIRINPASGLGPFRYSWSNGSENQELIDIPNGNYTVTVTDLNGCSGEMEVSLSSAAIEILYNGIDDDCDSSTPDDDLDNDGFGIADDCDDNNPSINPGGLDVAGNFIDEDCNGRDQMTSSIEPLFEEKIMIYPNPFSSSVLVELDSDVEYSIEVRSMLGQLVYLESNHLGKSNIDLAHLPPSVFLITVVVKDTKQRLTRRIVKK